jgi:alkylation response protein AidB-like acyl-CoA dehydrogenase
MEFRDSPEEAAFRARVRELAGCPRAAARRRAGDVRRRLITGACASGTGAQPRLDEKLTSAAGPLRTGEEYGGAGFSVIEQFILKRRWPGAGAEPRRRYRHGLGGADAVVHGTEERNGSTCPIVSGARQWCQGFSEPGR